MYSFPFAKHIDKDEKLKDKSKQPTTVQYVKLCE